MSENRKMKKIIREDRVQKIKIKKSFFSIGSCAEKKK